MAFLQDDDDAFEAALSFLDEFASGSSLADNALPSCWGVLDQDVRVPETDDPQRTKRTRHAARGRNPLSAEDKERRRAEFNEKRKLLRKAGVYGDANRTRNERAREIAQLREEAEKLQIDLQILQTRHQATDNNQSTEKKKLEEGGIDALATRNTRTQLTSMWQGLANQQRRRRQEAERDNVLLRLAVERQRKVANDLTRQMQRRAAQLTNECASLITTAPSSHHSFNVLDFHGDLEGFRGLFRRLDDAYRNLDNVFMTNGLAGMTVPPGDLHVLKCGDGKSLEFVSYKVLPFDVHATAEATWIHFKGVEKHLANGNLYEKAEKGLDEPYTIIADFKKEVYSNSSRADIKVKQVIRRHVEEDRDIVLWVSRAVPIEIKHKILQGLTYHLQGYAVTRRSSESTPDREVSVLQLCYLVSLDQDVDVQCDAVNLQALINFLVATTQQNIRAHRERIENALIDRSLAQRKI